MGKTSWSKGLTKETDERVKKISDAQKGKVKVYKNGHPKGMLGKIQSKETKEKIRTSCKKVIKTVEWNRKNSEAHKGKIFSEEHRKNISLAQQKLNRERNKKGQFI